MNFSEYNIVLASGSPRRKQMLEELGLNFTVRTKDTDESYPETIKLEDIAEYLAVKKADAFSEEIGENELIITADTIVLVDDIILGKPKDEDEAVSMLKKLSDKSHSVITGVCLMSKYNTESFSATTKVFFKELTDEEIDYYIEEYKPFDKAGAYGIQEWIGLVGVERIEGSYFNVVGLPIQRLYTELVRF